MKKFTKQKGITLIALIITIIVMLILVGVTINVALNGGLFNKAKTASDQTQRQVSKEQLIAAMIGGYDSNGNFVATDVELPEGAKWCIEDDEDYTEVTQSQSTPTNWVITENNNKFYIDENGSVLDEKPVDNPEIDPEGQPEDDYVTVQLTTSQIGANAQKIKKWLLVNIGETWTSTQIQELKGNTTANQNENFDGYYYFNNIKCSDNSLNNISSEDFGNSEDNGDNYFFVDYLEIEGNSYLVVQIKKGGTFITDENYSSDTFKDITFTISSAS